MRHFWKQTTKKIHLTTTQIIMLTFLCTILIGSLLLMLPAATASGERCPFVTALFTSTTSVCVTGLVVVDTFSYWSFFGKLVILILIQIGGLGVITLWAMLMILMRRQLSLGSRLIVRDYFNLDNTRGLMRFMKRVIKAVLFLEGAGAIAYCFILVPRSGFFKGVWESVFTSVSALCNAGIDIFGPDSLASFQTNLPINIITMVLIVSGGLGFVVWFDLIDAFKARRKTRTGRIAPRLHEHTHLVLWSTIILLIAGFLMVMIGEFHNPGTIGDLPLPQKMLASMFQSVTFRTAGFSTIPQAKLTPFTCISGLFYMFIGGSPAGTAGGVKTVTVAIIYLNAAAYIRQKNETVVFGRRITAQMVAKAIAVVTVSLSMTIIFTLMLVLVSDAPALSAAYEIFSATGTVGLSRGLTSTLNTAGRLIVILAMYAGRIAPISMMLFFTTKDNDSVRYPTGMFLIG